MSPWPWPGSACAAVAVAQATQQPAEAPAKPAAAGSEKPWVAPGTPGSPIKGELFHAQVLLSAHGFSPGVIDGKAGESFKLVAEQLPARRAGLKPTGKLDNDTRRALLQANLPSTVMVQLTADDVRSQYVFPFPGTPKQQAELKFLGYRNMLEKLAERYHTTPDTIVALNGPEKLIGLGHRRCACPMSCRRRATMPVPTAMASAALNALNINGQQPQGDYVVVDKSEGVLKVYRGALPSGDQGETKPAGAKPSDAAAAGPQLVAAFPVTMGSKEYPLPIGRWKATTYAFLPPFKYQPEIAQQSENRQGTHLAARTQRPGRRGLARPDQGALRDPRNSGAANHWPRRIERLHPHDQLGRAAPVADDETGLHGDLPGLTHGARIYDCLDRYRHRDPCQRVLDLRL